MAVRLLAAALVLAGCRAPPPLRIVSVEEHHEAAAAWAGLRGAVLVHLDAHADLADREEGDEPDVSNFVLPAIRAGIVREYWWVPPPWLVAPDPGADPPCPLRVVPLADLPAPPAPWILDVDLDFFACENPHAGHRDREISAEEYEATLAAGTVRMRGRVREGDVETDSAVLRRPPGPYSWPVRLDRIEDLATGEVRHVRGFVCMGLYADAFPVHRPAEAEWRDTVRAVGERVRAFPTPPAAATISRSAGSGFVPADRVAGIEAALRAALNR